MVSLYIKWCRKLYPGVLQTFKNKKGHDSIHISLLLKLFFFLFFGCDIRKWWHSKQKQCKWSRNYSPDVILCSRYPYIFIYNTMCIFLKDEKEEIIFISLYSSSLHGCNARKWWHSKLRSPEEDFDQKMQLTKLWSIRLRGDIKKPIIFLNHTSISP